MAKERLGKNIIKEAVKEDNYTDYIVVLKKQYESPGRASRMTFVPDILGKIKINNYVRYVNLDTHLENKFAKKIESFKSKEAAENFIKKNQQIFDFILNDDSKVRLETLRKIVNIKWDLLMEKTSKKDSSKTSDKEEQTQAEEE